MKKSTGTAIVTVMGVALVGTAAFLFSRPAAAKDKAKKAFAVDPHCASFLLLDEKLAKRALMDAAIVVAPTPDSNAIEALKAILKAMFSDCDWTDPPDSRVFIRGLGNGQEQHLTWADIKGVIGDRTVAELTELLEQMGVMQGGTINDPWLVKTIFGTGGCLSCAGMGTGARHRPVAAGLSAGVATQAFLPPKLPMGWFPVETQAYKPQNFGFRRWFTPLEAPTASSNVVPAILHWKNTEHEVMIEMIHTSATRWKGRIVPGTGTGAAKIPTWLPVDPPRHELPLHWITLDGLVHDNIYMGIIWKRSVDVSKKPHTQRSVQVEVRDIGGGQLEARVLT